MLMSEPGKVEERRSTDMSLYHLLRKAGNGLSDILSRECTPAEIKKRGSKKARREAVTGARHWRKVGGQKRKGHDPEKYGIKFSVWVRQKGRIADTSERVGEKLAARQSSAEKDPAMAAKKARARLGAHQPFQL
jgi:hypothetical protein